MSFTAIFLRCVSTIGRIFIPKAKQLYAERDAGKLPDRDTGTYLDEHLDESLCRLGSAGGTLSWWKAFLNTLGTAAVQPELFKRPHVQKWLESPETRYHLKQLAIAKITGNTLPPESHQILVSCYIKESSETSQHADSVITIALAILEASVKSSVKDPGVASLVQANGKKQQKVLNDLREDIKNLKSDDMQQIITLAQNHAKSIQGDIGGIHIERKTLLLKVEDLLKTARFIQIRGLPGSGKSVLIKQLVNRALANGPVLFLRAEQLEGKSWVSYANTQGLSIQPPLQLLSQIEEVGTPILFIDAIDRTEKEQQPVILDIIRTINQSPKLQDWRIVTTLRDTSVDTLQHWLGDSYKEMSLGTLSLDNLSSEEAEVLAVANPSLRSLLFGSAELQGIVRRPFFAKVLHQNYTMDPQSTFQPRSEVDLIANWWQRGGYNETGQDALERQRLLINLAKVRAHSLSKPIKMDQLSTVAHIEALKSDGLIQSVRDGISVRFTHDIFFEWAFFHVLAEREEQWIFEIQSCGEPPALARVVELVAQWEYGRGENWRTCLTLIQSSGLRTQWLRAWLLGPLGLPDFLGQDDEYTKAVLTDDVQLFYKALVWFQAAKITPNQSIPTSELSPDIRQRYAYLASWPSDYLLWRHFIEFILTHITTVPQRLYPEVLAVFEVWQNAFFCVPNPVTHLLLLQCDQWLKAIESINYHEGMSENVRNWHKVPDLEVFQKSLRQLILLSSRAEPALVSIYLQQASQSHGLRSEVFHDMLAFSPQLAKSHPREIVALAMAYFRQELPEDQIAREAAERKQLQRRLDAIRAKPKIERTPKENTQLENSIFFQTFGAPHYDWGRLCLDDGYRDFWPPSPLREPFHSLFQYSPEDALHLVRELCNHATKAWRQMHTLSHESPGTPVPLELIFPWGLQQFWGTAREYQWFRATGAPNVIGCAMMALEEWCFAEIKRGRPLEELLKQVITGNDSIAVLGIAAILTLQTETVSETTLLLLTSPRVLNADHQRMRHDITSSRSGLTSFNHKTDSQHLDAIHTANLRQVRQQELKRLISSHFISGGEYSEVLRNRLLSFKDNLPFEYEEQRALPQCLAKLRARAQEYVELVDWDNYRAYAVENRPNLVAISYTSPSSATPENISKGEEASRLLNALHLLRWASDCLEKNTILDAFTLPAAITAGREIDASDVLPQSADKVKEASLSIYRGALSAVAAVVLNFREETSPSDLNWARDVLMRVLHRKEIKDDFWTPDAITDDHPAIFAVKGLAAELRAGIQQHDIVRNILVLVTHPLKAVSLAAIQEACALWIMAPKLTWAALILALSRSSVSSRSLRHSREKGDIILPPTEAEMAIEELLDFYKGTGAWPLLPVPPYPWGKRLSREDQSDDESVSGDSAEKWDMPAIIWQAEDAGKILSLIPVESILTSERKDEFLKFLQHALNWTIQKYTPPGRTSVRDSNSLSEIVEWSQSLGTILGQVAGLTPLSTFKTNFLTPIINLEDNHFLELLHPLVNVYICRYVYNSQSVPHDAVTMLELCLYRLLKCPEFDQNASRRGMLTSFYQPRLVNTLMFISVEQAGASARYANGDWSELPLILPIVDHFIRAAGWVAPVMSSYLTLCERAKATYPAGMFAEQIISVLSLGTNKLKDWQHTILLERIAELIQYFAHRDTPLLVDQAQKLLKVLDILVDMGDRRSALLQLSESFREIRREPRTESIKSLLN